MKCEVRHFFVSDDGGSSAPLMVPHNIVGTWGGISDTVTSLTASNLSLCV